MLTTREAVLSLYGAWRLARLDVGGMAFFDTSLGGFWRSFYAALFVAPLYAALLVLNYAEDTAAALPRYASVEAIAYVINWFAFPLVMVVMSRVLEREERYLGYIVAYNWAAVLQSFFLMPFVMLEVSGALPDGLAGGLVMVVLSAVLLYTWFVTRTALAIGTAVAVGVVVVDLILSLFIESFAASML